MASVTVSGTLTINIEGLEEEMKKIEALKSKISATLRNLLNRVNRVTEADNWPDIHEGSEQFKKILETAIRRIESKSDRIKAEINKVLDQIKQNESKVQSKFGELLVKAGQAVKGEPTTVGPDGTPQKLREKLDPKNWSYNEKIKYLDKFDQMARQGETGLSQNDAELISQVKDSFTPLQKSMYDLHKKTGDFNYNLKNKSTGSIKNLFSGSSSILTDIKNRGNDTFLKIFGNKK